MKQLRLFAAVCAALLAVAAPAAGLEKPKYIFLFIGDGMGAPQVSLAAEFCGKPQLFDGFETVGLTATRSLNSYITDSAAAGTALASGSKTNSGMVGRAPDGTPLPSYVIAAREKGRKVGVVTSVSLDHATPAAFYANVPSRSNYYDIAVQMGRSGIDYLAGGGLLRPAGKKKDRPDAYRLAEENGYTVVRTVDAFDALKRGAGKTIVISPEPNRTASLPYAIDRRDGVPTLAALTARGIELLDNPNGFFLMVEGGMIDWACHANDAATRILAAKAGIGWTTYAHTALPVMTFARGVNAELFSNYYDNTHIAELIRAML